MLAEEARKDAEDARAEAEDKRAAAEDERKDAEEARRKAERLAPLRLGVVAFAVSADTEMGDYDEEPTIIFKSGQLPPPFGDPD